jgi:hypothetical protein
VIAHIMGLPIEESLLQLAPAGAALMTAVAFAGRTALGHLRRRLSHQLGSSTRNGDLTS